MKKIAPDTVIVTVTSANAPLAKSGSNTTVKGGQAVQLESSASQGAGREGVIHRWEQIAGTPVTLQNPNSANPSFVAPNVNDTLQFRLIVSDRNTATGEHTMPDHECLSRELREEELPHDANEDLEEAQTVHRVPHRFGGRAGGSEEKAGIEKVREVLLEERPPIKLPPLSPTK